jgi:hypothetical protein
MPMPPRLMRPIPAAKVKPMPLGSSSGPGAGVGANAPSITKPAAPAMVPPVTRAKGVSKVPAKAPGAAGPKDVIHPQSHAAFMKLGS